ncbi:oligosaccharide flippase family protein [Sphingobacterium sp.]|uniref:oligosaccharide flippase family protein n=1 Tax=Sphingobacterium sp. TaxID=341027 RepID=UPI0031D5165E
MKIYLWQGISMVLNFLSMFVVVPFLSSNPQLYGVYTICISTSIFLAYADLGFINAGQKYAAEYFSQDNRTEEIKVIGFSSFILFLFLLLFVIGFALLSLKPELLISGLDDTMSYNTASSLLLILALSTPLTLLQRMLQMICGIRLADYIVQRTNTLASIIKISAVFWFFRSGHYDIVGYFLFTQIITLLTLLITMYVVRKQFSYNFIALFRSFRFSREVFTKTKSLAFTSLFMTFSWILYYELDSVVIGKIFGAEKVAIYAIGLTLLSFSRSIFGILFSPFNARFNHFIGKDDEKGLRSFYLQVTSLFAPVVIPPILAVCIMAGPLVLSWVGGSYKESILIAQYLILCNLLAFISYPTGILLMAKEQIKKMYLINTLLPFIFWLGIGASIHYFGLQSFALFKLVAFFIGGITYYYFMLNYLKISFVASFRIIFKPLLIPCGFILVTALSLLPYMQTMEKSKTNLLLVAAVVSGLIIIAFILQYTASKAIRDRAKQIIKQVRT